LLNYTIEFLASSGVREIWVLCRAHADAVEAHIKSLKGKIGVEVNCLKSLTSKNLGDALRHVHGEEIFQQDFVLVYGDVVSNQRLLPIIQEHVMRREKDKHVLLTMLLTKAIEDQELSKLRIPGLNNLFSSGPAAAMAGHAGGYQVSSSSSTLPSTNVTPHASSLIANDSSIPGSMQDESPLSSGVDLSSSFSSTASRGGRTSSVSMVSSSPGTSSVSWMDHAGPLSQQFQQPQGSLAQSQQQTSLAPHVMTQSTSNAPKFGDSPVYLTVTSNESKLVVMDDETGQVFLYEDRCTTHSSPHVELDTSLLRTHRHILVRNDLQDSGVVVCSPEVLGLLLDHFDYETIPQLVRGVINDELQEWKVYGAIAESHHYTNRVSSLRRYHQITADVLKRWSYPQVLDSNIMPHTSWSYSRPGVYKEHGVRLHRDCKVMSNCAIGKESSLSAGVVVAQSTIGRNCNIGRNVKISHSFIWDNVTIEDDVILDHVIVCSGAKIGQSAHLSHGCVIGQNVVIGPSISLPPLTKLSAFGLSGPNAANSTSAGSTSNTNAKDADDGFSEDYSDEEGYSADGDDEEDERKKKASVTEYLKEIDLGTKGNGRKWIAPPTPFNELYTGWETVHHIRELLASMNRASRGAAATAAAAAAAAGNHPSKGSSAGTGKAGVASSSSNQQGTSSSGANQLQDEDGDSLTDNDQFRREVGSIVTGYDEDPKKDMSRLVMEVNAQKYAHDSSFLDCISAIFATLLSRLNPNSIVKSLKEKLLRFNKDTGGIFKSYLLSADDEKEFIFFFEEYCEEAEHATVANKFKDILALLYDLELISEKAFLGWAEEHEADDEEEEESKLYKSAKPFIEWLQEAEEEDEEDDEEDEEDE